MTRKKRLEPPTIKSNAELAVSVDDASEKITKRIEIGDELLAKQIRSWDDLEIAQKESYRWTDYNGELLKRLFTNETLSEEYEGSSRFLMAFVGGEPSLSEDTDDLYRSVKRQLNSLRSILERLELFPVAASVASLLPAPHVHEQTGQKVFLVHGHDEGARETVARFLERLGLEAIILHEHASGNRTIIEKIEHYSDVGFAVVLLTPDDVGTVANETNSLNRRARQNVILELGYFIGKLGRSNVCALKKGEVELPSDFLGVVYIPLDEGSGWKLQVAKELRAARFEIDMNDAL